jgi:hypothetical protein
MAYTNVKEIKIDMDAAEELKLTYKFEHGFFSASRSRD